eukprot:COSAG06_NODE_63406_length_262_cov_0.846626_1_plen_28_part_01
MQRSSSARMCSRSAPPGSTSRWQASTTG